MTYVMKLQSPDWDGVGTNGGGAGYELPLPVTSDALSGSSMAQILTLFEGDNRIFDFKQLREVVGLSGRFTVPSALEAGFENPLQMRDELRRTRLASTAGLNATGSPLSWLSEGSAYPNWGTATLPVDERDSSTARAEGLMRLIWDVEWDPVAGAYRKAFLYGTVLDYRAGPRPGATTRTVIPWSLTFGVGSVSLG